MKLYLTKSVGILMVWCEKSYCNYLHEFIVCKRTYEGTLYSSDLIIEDGLKRKHDLPDSILSLFDFSQASQTNIKPGELNSIVTLNKETIKSFSNCKLGFIHNSPYAHALSKLIVRRLKAYNHLFVKTFISEKGAMDWLSSDHPGYY